MANYSEGTKRLLIVGAIAAAAAYYGLPNIKSEIGDLGRQLRSAFPQQMVDPFGRLPRGEGDYEAAPDRGLRSPGGFRYGGYGAGGGDPRGPQGRPYRRWRDCTGSRRHHHCGPWQDGPDPGDGGGRW